MSRKEELLSLIGEMLSDDMWADVAGLEWEYSELLGAEMMEEMGHV